MTFATIQIPASGDGVTDDALAINAASAQLVSQFGGGTIELDAAAYNIKTTITRGPCVKIKGAFCGAGVFGTPAVGTILKWSGASGGIVVNDTPGATATSWLQGGGLQDLSIDGNGKAAIGLLSQSTMRANYRDLHICGGTGTCFYFSSISPNNTQALANYHSNLENCSANATGQANGFIFDGPASPSVGGRNTCFLNGRNLHASHENGTAFGFLSCDDIVLVGCGASRVSGGTGPSLYYQGVSDNSGRAAYGNMIFGFNANSQIVAAGGSNPSRGNLIVMTSVDGFPGLYQTGGATVSLITLDGELGVANGFCRGLPPAG